MQPVLRSRVPAEASEVLERPRARYGAARRRHTARRASPGGWLMHADEKLVAEGHHLMLAAGDRAEAPVAGWFDPAEWRRAGAVALETSGRGEVLIVAH